MPQLCKFFQQGTCRFGFNCKYEHSFGNKSKVFNSDKSNIGLVVAEDVTAAENGGQWILSCYGPFKEKPCIPEMDDISPEEIRWEMYQAQKNGTVDQVNHQFQQMCKAMKDKREALKNPTPTIVALLEKIQNSGSDAPKSNFAFSSPQLAMNNNSTTSTNPFGSNNFASSNSQFGTSFSSAPVSSSSVFNRSGKTNNAFGSSNPFGSSSTNTASVFGTNTASTGFGASQSSGAFNSAVSQGNSIFGGSQVQPVFGSSAFGSATPSTTQNSFLKPQTMQNSLFGSNNAFGNNQTVFGNNTSSTPLNNTVTFGQQNAFKTGPVFGGTATFGASQTNSVFGAPSFPNSTVSAPNVFGGTNSSTPSFNTLSQNSNVFAPNLGSTNSNVFGSPSNANQFGTSASIVNVSSFAPNNPEVNTIEMSSNEFVANNNMNGFGANNNNNKFGTNPALPSTNSLFGSVAPTIQSLGNQNAFGATAANSVFSTISSTQTSSTNSNPFKTPDNSTFGAPPNQNPFGNTGQSCFGVSITAIIDETAYSREDCLTDDEKAAYQAEQFLIGKIPLKPCTMDLR